MDVSQLVEIAEKFYQQYGYPFTFLASFIEITPMGWAIPGGLFIAAGGFFAYGEEGLSLVGILISAWLGAWLCLLLAYYFGNKTGDRLIKYLKQQKNAQRAKILLNRHGGVILTTSLLANLTRFWVAYVAGEQKYSLRKFIFYSGTASLGWVSLMAVVGYLAGYERVYLERSLAQLGIVAWGLVLLALGIIYWAIRKSYSEFKEIEE